MSGGCPEWGSRRSRSWHEHLCPVGANARSGITGGGTAESLRLVVGLEWDDTCLRFHESGRTVMTLSYHQVSKPIYTTSMKRREKYRDHLQPLIDGLEGRDQA